MPRSDSFALSLQGRTVVRAWTGSAARCSKTPRWSRQAGTANEGAAAAGFRCSFRARAGDERSLVPPATTRSARDALAVVRVLRSKPHARMRYSGRRGAPAADERNRSCTHGFRGAARRIAERIVSLTTGTDASLHACRARADLHGVPLFPSFITFTGVAFPGVSLVPVPAFSPFSRAAAFLRSMLSRCLRVIH